MSPVLASRAGSATPPPHGTQSDLARCPLPRLRRWRAPVRESRTTSTLQSPSPRTPRAAGADGPSVSQPPDTRTPGSPTPPLPGSPSPSSAPSPVSCCGRLRGPSDSRYPLPRLRLRCLHLGQESPARRPQTAGPGTRPHGSASAPPIALSARHSAQPLL